MEAPYTLIDTPAGVAYNHLDVLNHFWLDMALAHNVFLRFLNNIHEIAAKIKPGDESAFAGYCKTGIDLIHLHHKGEEEILFRHLSNRLDMSGNIHEHGEFQGGLDAFYQYMKAVFNKQEEYDAEKTISLFRSFGDSLAKHLRDEIPTIQPEQLKEFEKSELDAMMKEHEEYVKKKSSLFLVLPWCLSHHNSQDRPDWPPLPGPLLWIARNVGGLKHPSYWKFSPYDMKGNPKQYAT
ncbi:hypothetical protein JOM56_004097 [Amanita muscaria]